MLDTSRSILEKVRLPSGKGEPFSFDIKRDDLIDSVISGNKWRKLKYNILNAESRKNKGILTFGGPFSNHLIATAKATNQAGLKSIGIVRGDELTSDSNSTLKNCQELGMKLVFISRTDYRDKDDSFFIKQLHDEYPNYYIVPEGGRSYYGVVGCQEILSETPNDYDHVYLSAGTGTTGTGVVLSAPEKTRVHIVSALKGGFMKNEIAQLLYTVLNDEQLVETYLTNLVMHNESHFGGYAKVPAELLADINRIYASIHLKLDPIYTAKAFLQMESDFINGKILPDEKVLFIHTGGLQGALTWKDKIDYLK